MPREAICTIYIIKWVISYANWWRLHFMNVHRESTQGKTFNFLLEITNHMTRGCELKRFHGGSPAEGTHLQGTLLKCSWVQWSLSCSTTTTAQASLPRRLCISFSVKITPRAGWVWSFFCSFSFTFEVDCVVRVIIKKIFIIRWSTKFLSIKYQQTEPILVYNLQLIIQFEQVNMMSTVREWLSPPRTQIVYQQRVTSTRSCFCMESR